MKKPEFKTQPDCQNDCNEYAVYHITNGSTARNYCHDCFGQNSFVGSMEQVFYIFDEGQVIDDIIDDNNLPEFGNCEWEKFFTGELPEVVEEINCGCSNGCGNDPSNFKGCHICEMAVTSYKELKEVIWSYITPNQAVILV